MRILLIVLLFIGIDEINAQQDTIEIDGIYTVINLDEFVVTASQKDFDVADFIKMVREDKSFYQAFRNLRFKTYQSDNEVLIFDKKRKEKASYHSKIKQTAENSCREMEILSEEVRGKYYKRKRKPRYYTAKMYERLFFTKGKFCESQKEGSSSQQSSGRMEGYISELKTLIFQPGERVDVPLIGKKMAIFDKKMQPYYDYQIRTEIYPDGTDCYVFEAKVKPVFIHKKQKTVVKYLRTYFAKADFQIIARDYHLEYNGALFDFDVKMDIELQRIGTQYLPKNLSYNGRWDVPAKRPEIVKFETSFMAFE